MTWLMPAETAPHDRIWMAFPRACRTLSIGDPQGAYEAWTAVAHAVADFEPVTMVVDPSELRRARRMLSAGIELVEAPLDDFWMRDFGPTFVLREDGGDGGGSDGSDSTSGSAPASSPTLGAVDWRFNAWGGGPHAEYRHDGEIARLVGALAGAEPVPSTLVNEGGAIHVDGEGTVIITETVQLDPLRNPNLDKQRVEAELLRTIGATHVIWLPRGLTRDYEEYGTRGHVDMVAAIPSPGTVLLHQQQNPDHPDAAVSRDLRAFLQTTQDAAGRDFHIVDLPAPAALEDAHGFVDWNYVNHLVVNDGIIACGYDDDRADGRAREVLAEAYPGRRVVTVDAREILLRGGGIHCITQQQPSVPTGQIQPTLPTAPTLPTSPTRQAPPTRPTAPTRP
ncbi:agmatine deiminase family protein [Subtercola boreus]|uniref:Agmatine deiminase n=1 Tax=Subtercola boreus TaxID=120213 RepID=A0A3E0WCZ4_9MICO|nr:agmatine deiminase family protein [Subtercola boreus]RFA21171.1 agmatine deiminase [Subtercola boreus]RFA21554.1 agmatine deiminase [Subtercola boreus]RFA27524.1 agmatine deiminase [Subtercola boreus]